MNKRGHIGTALMPVLALILVINGLFVMLSFNGDISKTKAEFDALKSKSSATHEFLKINLNRIVFEAINASNSSSDFESVFSATLKEIANRERSGVLNTNLYAKLGLGEYSFSSEDSNYILNIENLFETTSVGINEATYSYSLTVTFDKTHVISIEERIV